MIHESPVQGPTDVVMGTSTLESSKSINIPRLAKDIPEILEDRRTSDVEDKFTSLEAANQELRRKIADLENQLQVIKSCFFMTYIVLIKFLR